MRYAFLVFNGPVLLVTQGMVKMLGPALGVENHGLTAQGSNGLFAFFHYDRA